MEYDRIGDEYQNLTRYVRGSLPRRHLDWGSRPPLRKTFPDSLKTVKLPAPSTDGGPPVWRVIRSRRSRRFPYSTAGGQLFQLFAGASLPEPASKR